MASAELKAQRNASTVQADSLLLLWGAGGGFCVPVRTALEAESSPSQAEEPRDRRQEQSEALGVTLLGAGGWRRDRSCLGMILEFFKLGYHSPQKEELWKATCAQRTPQTQSWQNRAAVGNREQTRLRACSSTPISRSVVLISMGEQQVWGSHTAAGHQE